MGGEFRRTSGERGTLENLRRERNSGEPQMGWELSRTSGARGTLENLRREENFTWMDSVAKKCISLFSALPY